MKKPNKILRVGWINQYPDIFVAVDINADLYMVFCNKFIKDGLSEYMAVPVSPETVMRFLECDVNLLDIFIPDVHWYTLEKDEDDFLGLVDLPEDFTVNYDRLEKAKDFDEDSEFADYIMPMVFCKRIIKDKAKVIKDLTNQFNERETK